MLRKLFSKYILHRDSQLLSISDTQLFSSLESNSVPGSLYTDPPRSAAVKYTNVPAPDDPLTPISVAVRWTSHDLYGEEMPGIAADLLEKGFDSLSLRRLAGETKVHSRDDIEPLVNSTFRQLGVDYPLRRKLQS